MGTNYENRRYLVILTSIKEQIDFSQVLETSVDTLRMSVDGLMANGFRIGMGGDETAAQNYDGFFQEILLYNGDNSTTDRSAITTNQNTYYGVY